MHSLSQQLLNAFEERADDLFRHCYLRILDRTAAKDILKNTFTRAWSYLAEGSVIGDIKPFLYRTINGLIAEYRAIAPESVSKSQPSDDPLFLSLEVLGEQERDVLVMRYVDHFEPQTIAEITGQPLAVVSARLLSGQRRLSTLAPS